MSSSGHSYPCPCCGYIVFDEGPGNYEICPICFWEDDPVQLRQPDFAGGANKPSLMEAQKNFSRLGATEERFLSNVRRPTKDDMRDEGWRPVDVERDIDKTDVPGGNNWPADRTVLYYWRLILLASHILASIGSSFVGPTCIVA